MIIKPKGEFQKNFLSSKADIVFGGGLAGVGKTYALLMEPLRYINNPKFGCVIFRRKMTDVKVEGGLWDTSVELYKELKGRVKPRGYANTAKWLFPSGSKLKFAHLQYEKNKYDYQGAQIPLICFDELTHFTQSMFFYMLSRNRSASGVKPYVRATMNPQPDGWIKRMLVDAGFIYPDDYHDSTLASYPIQEMDGVLRYFTRLKGKFIWADSSEEVIERLPKEIQKDYTDNDIKSFTFIAGKEINKELLAKDPSYKGNLLALDEEEQVLLLDGRWASPTALQMKLYQYRALCDLFTNTFIEGGKKYLTADIALEGSDKFTVGVWNGMRLEKVYMYAKSDGPQILATIKKLAHENQVPGSNICFDSDGVGGFLTGFFRTSKSFVNNSKAIPVNGQPQLYENLKTQCYYLLRKYINEYGMYIDPTSSIIQDQIIEELYAHEKAGRNQRNQLTITRKKEVSLTIGRSPDLADMIMMRMIFELQPKRKRKNKSRVY